MQCTLLSLFPIGTQRCSSQNGRFSCTLFYIWTFFFMQFSLLWSFYWPSSRAKMLPRLHSSGKKKKKKSVLPSFQHSNQKWFFFVPWNFGSIYFLPDFCITLHMLAHTVSVCVFHIAYHEHISCGCKLKGCELWINIRIFLYFSEILFYIFLFSMCISGALHNKKYY